ncbi:bifunctional serine/threonine-protein kinase/universal stress protein [Shinella zoogloeoides]|uniref:bifunctional serine/threonine-protein kinase/universal stress protein n=1 Tax=Shinella zoogloeoides TaxID=352475 RepID=UPI00273FD6D7|nr:bifunctional serine/threonine-protein kinase/universal stress protein [Shinella zoogloeoides]WLR94163.1 bifunctional serine/threonine-protein kinase/universal stress protein [Shinella zoogloeoides]
MMKARLKPGDVIDGFTIEDIAHNGGMARIWQVSRPDIDFPILMKVPVIGEGDDPAAIVGFEMEQMILPRLSGPHVPRFVANGDFATLPYIVMERLPGTSLYPLLERLPLPPEEVVAIGAKVAVALDSLHRQHVVHLDLKPSNVMFRESGEAVLIDYGLARHVHLPDLMDEQFRLPYGTAPYMAPEQVLGTRSDFRSDLFALGVMLYFFATGERPFGDPQRLKGLKRRLWRDPLPPRARNGAIPPALQEVILRCLEVNPAWRYPSAAQLALDLQDLPAVKLTARAEKMKRDPFGMVLRRRFNPVPIETVKPQTAEAQLADAPIVAVAIDLAANTPERAAAIHRTVIRIIENTPQARIACINVLKINRIAIDTSLDEEGRNKHVMRLVELRNWSTGLPAPGGGITFHVLEAVSPADAILDYARENHVDHIVMGARAESAMRSMLGSVSGEVAAHAPCTVTVVRNRQRPQ